MEGLFMNFTYVATIASPIVGVLAIIVSLYLGRQNTKDCDKQIKAINESTKKELKSLKEIIIVISKYQIFKLSVENVDVIREKCEIKNRISELEAKREELTEMKIQDVCNDNIDDINTHFYELSNAQKELLITKERLVILQKKADNISKALESLQNIL
ncbi:MAG: hypothetical protein KBT34_14165 [Prevotella sp.]|nr:hypothetical protein [Candidatus Prevotella equi]